MKQTSSSAKKKAKSCMLPSGTSITLEGPVALKVDRRDSKLFLTTGVQIFCRSGKKNLTWSFSADYKLFSLRRLVADLNVSKLTSLLNKEVEINMFLDLSVSDMNLRPNHIVILGNTEHILGSNSRAHRAYFS
jgi:hypothetical protein